MTVLAAYVALLAQQDEQDDEEKSYTRVDRQLRCDRCRTAATERR